MCTCNGANNDHERPESVRLTQLRQQLSEASARLGELDAAAINAVIEGKTERDVTALEVRKTQARDRIVLLQKAIKSLEHQTQLDAQAFMMRETMATIAPLTKALDDGAAKLACRRTCPINLCSWSRM